MEAVQDVKNVVCKRDIVNMLNETIKVSSDPEVKTRSEAKPVDLADDLDC